MLHYFSLQARETPKKLNKYVVASVLFLLSQGVHIFRVHNVNEVKQGILVFEKILLN